jgi:diaminohydroxyphosphoribosylaminopyrimidine deaminase/5-amino-6-(5-phosphoribosylamino)uracil reductase
LSPVGGDGVELMKDAYTLSDVTHHTFGEDIMIEGYIKQKKGDI